MAENKGYTHGGSAGKNFVLLLRSLVNIAAFAAFWYGVYFWAEPVGKVCAISGGILLGLCLAWNLLGPLFHSGK